MLLQCSPSFLSGTQLGKWFWATSLKARCLLLQNCNTHIKSWLKHEGKTLFTNSKWRGKTNSVNLLYLILTSLSPSSTDSKATATEIKTTFPIFHNRTNKFSTKTFWCPFLQQRRERVCHSLACEKNDCATFKTVGHYCHFCKLALDFYNLL